MACNPLESRGDTGRVPCFDNGWLFVTTDDGRFGYCVATHIDTDLPEPNAKIHWIEHGQSALTISQKYYGGKAEWGNDHRFYVSGLVYANQGEGRRGIFKPNQNIQVHPCGGRHGGSYYKISSSSRGIIKVVDRATSVPTLGEKATIIDMDGGLQGWMLQAAAANAAAQNTLEQLRAGSGGGDAR
ncbi:hypothetical protein [Archangium sp.]|uniref:hypothetical protein n=1 Tax=Archangium sp. TaxID=1872627 RepID=UPI00286B3D60|nr:hypothetical protein [Archangium sp.]